MHICRCGCVEEAQQQLKSDAACGQFTYDVLLQFGRELKAEGFTPQLAISSFPELEVLEWLKQDARSIASAFNISPQLIGDVRARSILDMQYELTLVTSASTDAYSWQITKKTYNTSLYFSHVGRCRPLPRRKLRKCHLRKIHCFLKQERRRYFLA